MVAPGIADILAVMQFASDARACEALHKSELLGSLKGTPEDLLRRLPHGQQHNC